MTRLHNSSITKVVGMQRLQNSFATRAPCFVRQLEPPGSKGLNHVSVQAERMSSPSFSNGAAPLLQCQLLARTAPVAERKQPSIPCLLDKRVNIFSVASQARQESRNKWLEAAQAVAGRSSEEETNKPPQPQRFIVEGNEIHLSTSPTIPGHSNVQYKGFVEGSAVRGRSVLEIWKQQLQQQLGGEQQLLHDLLKETRTSALQRLAEAAAAVGANAVVSVRLVTSGLQSMHVEYTAYGTAVRVSRANPASS